MTELADDAAIRETIAGSYLSEGLEADQIDQLVPLARLVRFEVGEKIVSQFEDSRHLIILRSGRAVVRNLMGDRIGIVNPGMPIGEVALIDDRPRSATVEAVEECEVVLFEAEPLMDLLRSRCDIALRALLNLSRVLCGRLRSANRQLEAVMAVEEAGGRS